MGRDPAALFLAAHLAIALALQQSAGFYDPLSLALALAATGLAAAALLRSRSVLSRSRAGPSLTRFAFACAGIEGALVLAGRPAMFLPARESLLPYRACVAAALLFLLVVFLSGERGRLARRAPWLLAAVYLGTGSWIVAKTPAPGIDVWHMQQEGALALLRGENPYASAFTDPTQGRFAPLGLSAGGKFLAYTYLPGNLLLTLPSAALLGDVRYGALLAMAAGAALLGVAARRSGACRDARLLAAGSFLLLFPPRGFFVIEQAWSEPYLFFLVAASVAAWTCGRPRLAAASLGLLFASKQYVAVFLPAALLLRRGKTRSLGRWALAAGVAVVAALPFALWSPAEFWNDVVRAHLAQGVRGDALSIPAAILDATGKRAPGWLPLATAGVATLFARLSLPRSPLAWPPAAAFIGLAFFVAAPLAFANYYFLLAALLVSAALLAGKREGRDDPSPNTSAP